MDPVTVHEAKGVTIHRTIGSDKLILLDPFLLLDHMSVPGVLGGASDNEIGFPLHPHRGIETLTWVLSGTVTHTDSLGNTDTITGYESQWMTAGGGIKHSEMITVGAEGHQGLQLWLNLPAEQKMIPPQYTAARVGDIPVVESGDGTIVRVIAGEFNGVTGAFTQIAVQPTLLAVTLTTGATITLPAPVGNNAFAYVYTGEGLFGTDNTPTPTAHLALFGDGDGVQATAAEGEVSFLFATAQPLNEPVLQYRSLVMNTVDQMKQALDDLKNDTFTR
jgi:hypothetical protein